jgi:hypothetical protein
LLNKSVRQKLGKIFHHWAPPVFCTFLAYYLGKGALDGVGATIDEAWASIGEWATDPVLFPRWFVLSGTVSVLGGGIFLWIKQYQRVKALSKSHDELLEGMAEAFDKAAKDLERR